MNLTEGIESHDSLPGYPAPVMTENVHGHGSNEAALVRAYKSGRLHHALMFSGRQGIGKAAFAFRLAKYLIENPEPESAPDRFCNAENNALVSQMASGAHPQVLHLTRPRDDKTGKFRTQLTIDETRRISRFLTWTIADKGRRIVIVDPVDDMNVNAANALLKNLEEPTSGTVFILISHASGRLLPTIRSRCLVLPFLPLAAQPMRAALDDLGISSRFRENDLTALTTFSEGSPRLAAMLADCGGLEILNAAQTILDSARFDQGAAARIGEAVAGRDGEMLFDVIADQLLNRTGALARELAASSPRRSLCLSNLHQSLSRKIGEAVRYNLDRKQLIFFVLQKLHEEAAREPAG